MNNLWQSIVNSVQSFTNNTHNLLLLMKSCLRHPRIFLRRYGWIFVSAIIIYILANPLSFRQHLEVIDALLVPDLNETGLILVDSPRIFTRGRLVNDRSYEAQWLEKQLSRTDQLLLEKAFKIDGIEINGINSALSLQINSSNQTSSNLPNTENQKDQTDLSIITKKEGESSHNNFNNNQWLSISPIDEYQRAFDYRKQIRTDLMSTTLDDRHDINGNTIFRLDFNLVVLPPPGSRKTAIVAVSLSEPKDSEKNKHYEELLDHWEQHITELSEKLIQDRMSTLNSGKDFSGIENYLFQTWLDTKIHSEFKKLKNNLEKKGYEIDQDFFPKDHIEDNIVNLPFFIKFFNKYNILFDENRENFIKNELKNTHQTDSNKVNTPEFLLALCKKGGDFSELPIKCPPTRKLPVSLMLLKFYTMILDINSWFVVENNECSQPNENIVTKIGSKRVPIELLNEEKFLYSIFPELDVNEGPDLHAKTGDCFDNWLIEIKKLKRRNILANEKEAIAEFTIHSLLGTELYLRDENNNIVRLDDFFEYGRKPNKFSISQPCIPGTCSPGITIKGTKSCKINSNSCLQVNREKIAKILQNILSSSQQAFTYSVEANRQYHYSLKSNEEEQRVSGSFSNVDVAHKKDLNKKTNERISSIIGIGDWGTSKEEYVLCQSIDCKKSVTKFAWAIPSQFERLDFKEALINPRDYSVSAHISLPGWWKKAHINVTTCWVKDFPESTFSNVDILCSNSFKKEYDFKINVPGDISDLMQALKFEIVRYPYIEATTSEEATIVEVGRPASIVIKGLRLWRSPSVWLNNQKADLVETLPTMKGIVATFNCINPKAGTTGSWEEPYFVANAKTAQQEAKSASSLSGPAKIEVFTSEGSASTLDKVRIVPFVPRFRNKFTTQGYPLQQQYSKENVEFLDNPCWVNNKK